jgi:hypothetical protein
MAKGKLIHIFLYFTVESKMLEIQVSETASFHDILEALNTMSECSVAWKDAYVYEQESQMRCDMDVALYSLHAVSGMVFQVF